MNILIIEDEVRAVNQLQTMLKACDFKFELMGIIDTVEEAIVWFNANETPDLVFLDIQLADGLSFEIFQKTSVQAPIIFTTAFDQYAIKAFKVNSVDYLLKPLKKDELKGALNKFLLSRTSAMVDSTTLNQLLSDLQGQSERDSIMVKSGGGFVRLKISDLLYCYSEDSVTFGVTVEKRFIVEETINELFCTLNKRKFFKINRAQIVAKSAIAKIEPYFNHRLILSMTNAKDREFIVSRPKASDFKAWMNE